MLGAYDFSEKNPKGELRCTMIEILTCKMELARINDSMALFYSSHLLEQEIARLEKKQRKIELILERQEGQGSSD